MKSTDRWLIVLIILAILAWSIGTLLKIRHWPYGDEILLFSYVIMSLSLLLAFVKIVKLKRDH